MMSYRNVHTKFGQRKSEEYQLLAEEKWIIETITKIKNQRNCLQIERLHLESLKSKIKSNRNNNHSKVQNDAEASTSAVNMMQSTIGKDQKETEEIRLNDATCNVEELNLVVTTPVFNKNVDFNEDEFEEESDDDMFIDINMLMNGALK